MFFCVGVLAPPASALMRDPDQPRVDERLPEGDEGGWGNEQSSIVTNEYLKFNTFFSSIPYLYTIEILYHFNFRNVLQINNINKKNVVEIISINDDKEIRTNTQTYSR